MARVTVEDCIDKVDNRFELVLLASPKLGVSTLELDVQITEDGYAVVTHDRDPSPRVCTDTAPAFPGDPEYPYVPGTRYLDWELPDPEGAAA